MTNASSEYLNNRKLNLKEFYNYWRHNFRSGVLRFVERILLKMNVSDRLAGNLTQILHLPEIQNQVKKFELIRPAQLQESIQIRIGKFPSVELQNSSAAQYIVGIKNAHVDLLTGLVVFQNGLVFDATLSQWQKLLYRGGIGSTIKRVQSASQRIDGTWAILPHTPFYYHFVIEELPTILELMRKKLVAGILISELTPTWAKEALNVYRVPFEELKNNSLIIEEYYCITAPRAVLKSTLDVLLISGGEHKTNFLLTRGNADRSNSSIEGQIISKLSVDIRENEASEYSFSGQQEIFKEARSIIGLHGGALTNMIWMRPGGKVVEIFNHPFHTYDYARLARELKHSYLGIFVENELSTLQLSEIGEFLNE